MLALFVGLAPAQVTVGGAQTGPLTCQANPTVPYTLRQEGMTELVGDILITCTGGSPLPQGSTVPTANITVSLAGNVTSRLISGSGSATLPANTSEALLLVDEPNSDLTGQKGVGPTASFNVCANSALGASVGGCTQIVSNATAGGAFSNPAAGQTATSCTAGVCTAAVNAFQGLVNANQVTFLGIPVNPPVSAGTARIYRITNVRFNVNGSGLGSGSAAAGTTPVTAFISISGLLLGNAQPVVGFVQKGLDPSSGVRRADNTDTQGSQSLAQCNSFSSPQALRVIRFAESFATAFKTRVNPGGGLSGQGNTGFNQNIPGTLVNGSESGLIIPVNGGMTAGLADYGTRLKATFNSIPAGLDVYVSTTNVTNASGSAITSAAPSYAQLVFSEAAPEGQVVPSSVPFGSTTISITKLVPVNGSATATWEVINTNPGAIENAQFDFAVYYQYSFNPTVTPPTPVVATTSVSLSYAPTPAGTGISATDFGKASSASIIPRFADSTTSSNILSVALCKTTLLFPYLVDGVAGLTTGIAISNTSADPYSTRNQSGTCKLNFFGRNPSTQAIVGSSSVCGEDSTGASKCVAAASATATDPAAIKAGTTMATVTAAVQSNFVGYMIAECDFQLAHGYAAISDVGLRQLFSAYLALVVTTGTGNRNAITESLGN